MTKKEEVLKSIATEQTAALLKHFNSIYKCSELTEHEYKIIYLAWMWANGMIYDDNYNGSVFDEKAAGVPLNDYEITFEAEESGGVNLDYFDMYYGIEKIIDLMKWKK